MAAVVLVVSTFLDWFGERANTHGLLLLLNLFDPGRNAWEALAVVPIVLVVAAAAGLMASAARILGLPGGRPPALDAATAVLGLASAALVLAQILSPPAPPHPDAGSGITIETTLRLPIWIALGAALVLSLTAWSAVAAHGRSWDRRPSLPSAVDEHG